MYRTHSISWREAASPPTISLTKQKLIFAVALDKVRSKLLVRSLYLPVQALELSITHRAIAVTNPDFSCLEGMINVVHLGFFYLAKYFSMQTFH